MSLDEREITLKTNFTDKLFKFRSNPQIMIPDLEAVRVTIGNQNTSLQKEIESVIDLVNKKKTGKSIKYSEGLSRAANKQINLFLQSGEAEFNSNTKCNKDTAEVLAKKYLEKCGKIFQIQDSSKEEKSFFTRIFITSTDKQRQNLKILLDDDMNFFGIGVKNLGKNFLVNILFSNEAEEKLEFNIDDMIVNEINNLRIKSVNVLKHYNEVERKILNAKTHLSEEEIDKFYDYISNNENSNQTLERSPILDDIAYQMLNHSSESDNIKLVNHKDGVYIPPQEELESITYRFLSEYRYVENFIVQGTPQNCEEFIERILFTGRKHDNDKLDNIDILLLDKNFKNIGLAYQEMIHPKTKEKIAFISVFLIDSFSAAPKRPFTVVMREEFNKLRKNPKSFLEDLKNFEKIHKYKYSDEANFKQCVEKVEKYLKVSESLPELSYSQELHEAANEYCYFIRSSRNHHYYEEEEELLKIRLNHYIENYRHASEIVAYNNFREREMIISLLIKEAANDLTKNGNAMLLGKTFRYFGVCERFIREKSLVCMIFTDSAKKKILHDKQFKKDLIEDLNLVRRYPKAYMKFVGVEYNPFKIVNNKSSPEEILLNFLAHTRSYEEFIEEKQLSEAAQKYVFDTINENQEAVSSASSAIATIVNKVSSDKKVKLKSESQEFLRNLLTAYGSGFTKICNIVENNWEDIKDKIKSYTDEKEGQERGNLNSKEYLIHILKVEENRENIFSLSANYFGVCVHEERKLVNIILVNEFTIEKPLFDYTKVWQTKAPRPNLTEDEVDVIKRDFKKIDIINLGKIYPELICKIFEENDLNSLNFIYYEALNAYSIEKPEEAKKGVNMEKFVEIVKHYLSLFSDREWIIIFTILKGKNNFVELKHFKNFLEELKFKFNTEEAESIFENACYPEKNLSQKKFIEIMMNIMKSANEKEINRDMFLEKQSSKNNLFQSKSSGSLNNSLGNSKSSFK